MVRESDRDYDFPEVCPLPRVGPLRERVEPIKEVFKNAFPGEQPDVVIRVPGRVNLIGEHIDYCGYPVCPMAIRQDILILAAVAPPQAPFLSLLNLDSEAYPPHVFNRDFEIDIEESGWAAYVLCGVRGAMDRLGMATPCNMRLVVAGSIPPGAGLSSSSALVSAAFLVTTYLNKLELSKTELAKLSAECEQLIGTLSGGMDQAIAFLASKGCAKHIEFSPLRTEDVPLPEGAVFVIAHSKVRKNKAESSDYNTRVVECRLAAQIMAKRKGFEWEKVRRLMDVHRALEVSLPIMSQLVKETFHDKPYSKEEVCEELGVTEEMLNKTSLSPNTIHLGQFKLKQRALHVFQEAERVKRWCMGCIGGWDLGRLGALMNASHTSLRSLYECSHPALDSLVLACLNSGALGARLTGAGWGGCVVAVTTVGEVDAFMDAVKKEFYEDKDCDQLMFPTEPHHGASIFML